MRFINSIAATLLLALSTLLGANAQDRLVSGTVLDTQQQPVIGASVMVAGTRQGTVTDPDGTFSLKIPEGDVTLEVACLGYTTVNTKVSAGTSRITVTLEEDNMLLFLLVFPNAIDDIEQITDIRTQRCVAITNHIANKSFPHDYMEERF